MPNPSAVQYTKGVLVNTKIKKTYRAYWYSSNLSGLRGRCCAFAIAMLLSAVGYVQHWKVGDDSANWGTGELSMRSRSFLHEKKCSSIMKLELNWSEIRKQ